MSVHHESKVAGLVAGSVSRPAVPAPNSQDVGTNSLATAVEGADLGPTSIDGVPVMQPPADFSGPGGPEKEVPAKAADADGWDYYARRGLSTHLWRYRPGEDRGEMLNPYMTPAGWDSPRQHSITRSKWHVGDARDFGPATRAECERFSGWTKANPDDHGDSDQPRRTANATAAALARVQCHACGQPTPTIDRAAHHASIVDRAIASEGNTDSPIEGALRADAVVREYARLSLIADIAQLDKQALGHQMEPGTDDEAEWTAYAKWRREYGAADRAYHAAFSAAYEFTKANRAALVAALIGGGE